MDETSDFKPKNPLVSRDAEVLAQLKLLTEHPAWETLRAEMDRLERKFYENFAHGLATSPTPIDQREVDEKRGFYKGIKFALNTFPKLSAREYDRFLAEAVKEADERGGSH